MKASVLLLSVLLLGCSQTATVHYSGDQSFYTHADLEAQYNKDRYVCKRETLMVPPAPNPVPQTGVWGGGSGGVMGGIEKGLWVNQQAAASRRQADTKELFWACMADRGWTRVP